MAIGHQASDQVRIYKETSPNNGNTSGVVGGLMHLQKYQRVRTEPLSPLTLWFRDALVMCVLVKAVVHSPSSLLYCLSLPLSLSLMLKIMDFFYFIKDEHGGS